MEQGEPLGGRRTIKKKIHRASSRAAGLDRSPEREAGGDGHTRRVPRFPRICRGCPRRRGQGGDTLYVDGDPFRTVSGVRADGTAGDDFGDGALSRGGRQDRRKVGPPRPAGDVPATGYGAGHLAAHGASVHGHHGRRDPGYWDDARWPPPRGPRERGYLRGPEAEGHGLTWRRRLARRTL